MRRQHSGRLTTLLALLCLLVLPACPPVPGDGGPVTATLLTDGAGVAHNGRPARSGERLDPGDWVRTDFAGAAEIRFSDGTRVRIVEADDPVYLFWGGNTLQIRIDNAVVEYVGGAVLEIARIIGKLAGVFDKSHSITVEDRTRSFRHLLLEGQAQMIFPQAGLPIVAGQYALVTPGGAVSIQPIPDQLLRELRGKLDRWNFGPREPGTDTGLPDSTPGDIYIGPTWPVRPAPTRPRTEGTRPPVQTTPR